MIDVCLITEGAWPVATGGLSTWTSRFVQALEGSELAVLSLPLAGKTGLRHEVPAHVKVCESTDSLSSLPEAKQYIASGLGAAEWFLDKAPLHASRLVYVEHGDLTRELLEFGATEGGRFVRAAQRRRAAMAAHEARATMARRVGLVAGVTRRTYRRSLADGAKEAIRVPNAVPPSDFSAPPSAQKPRLGFVGRNARIKGLDRFVDLCEHFGLDATACVLGEPSEQASAHVRWRFNHEDPWQESFSALLMPSRMEACPFVALEAEARGIPVILTDVADLDESTLVKRRPWNLEAWGQEAKRVAAEHVASNAAEGRRLAGARWATFQTQWRRISNGKWGSN